MAAATDTWWGRLRRGLGPDRRVGHHAGLFWIFCAGTFLAGFYGAYVQSYRFAAADTAEDALKAKAISLGRWAVSGAIIGPQLVIFTRDAVAGTPRWQLPQPGAAAADRLADPADAAHEPDPGRSSRR